MGLRDRPRIRALEEFVRGGAGLISTVLTYEVREIEDTMLMREAKVEVRKALDGCRLGNLEPHAFLLYERTIHPILSRIPDARRLGYGIRPEEIGSFHYEIREFWLQREAAKVERWIEELRAGNTVHRHSLRSLCLEYIGQGDDFVSRLSLSTTEVEELVGFL